MKPYREDVWARRMRGLVAGLEDCGHDDGWCGGPVRCTRGPRTWARADEYDPPPPDTYADDRAADRAADKEQERLQHDWRRA